MKGKISPTPKMTLRLAGSPSCVSLLYPHVVVGLKSAFFQNESIQQQEPDVIRYIVRLYDISDDRNGGKTMKMFYEFVKTYKYDHQEIIFIHSYQHFIYIACLRVMHGHESRIMTVKIYPKSRRILSGDEGGHVLVWNASTDKQKKGRK